MSTHRSHEHRRTDLFLIRVWVEGTSRESLEAQLHGRVQRVVDGEVCRFDNWQELMDALLVMLSDSSATLDP